MFHMCYRTEIKFIDGGVLIDPLHAYQAILWEIIRYVVRERNTGDTVIEKALCEVCVLLCFFLVQFAKFVYIKTVIQLWM